MFPYSGADHIDFGVDQLDIKRKMKKTLGPNVTLRLKFGQETAAVVGGKGYEMIPAGESQPTSTDMINVAVGEVNEKDRV